MSGGDNKREQIREPATFPWLLSRLMYRVNVDPPLYWHSLYLHDTIRLYLTALILHSEGVRSEQPPPDDEEEEEVEYSGR